MDLPEDLRTLRQVATQLKYLRQQIEHAYEKRAVDEILRQCWIGRQASDPRYGNVMEQISRVETSIKVLNKTGNTSDLHSAISRVDTAVGIHERFIGSSKEI